MATLTSPQQAFTVADACAASGLALRDATSGLNYLSHYYRGRLRVSESGELLHHFPTGFSRPWVGKEGIGVVLAALGRAALAVGRVVVRLWITVVLLVYVAIFLVLAIWLIFASLKDSKSSGSGGGGALAGFFESLGDLFFWSRPSYGHFGETRSYGSYSALGWNVDAWDHSQNGFGIHAPEHASEHASEEQKISFVEKVNRFVLGPEQDPKDPDIMRKRIVREIRARQGRIGILDVIRVTGLSRAETDPLMAKLMLDYEGDVHVSESGGIYYSFVSLRRSTRKQQEGPVSSIWANPPQVPPVTGNSFGTNLLIGVLNGLNLAGGIYGLTHSLTLANLFSKLAETKESPAVYTPGIPLLLGVIPLAFSLFVLLAPLVRGIRAAFAKAEAIRETQRLAVLEAIVDGVAKRRPISEGTLQRASTLEGSDALPAEELKRVVVDLGGDVDIEASAEAGEPRYRFQDLTLEQEALEDQRAQASSEERSVGKIVFDA
jgi:hypothetical protein